MITMSYTTCAEINLDHLAHNVHCIRERVAPARVIPVVKADAYGHGAVACVRRLVREGCTMFAVAQFQEAMELRESGIDQPILVLGRVFPDVITQAIRADLHLTVFGEEDLRWIEAAGAEAPAQVHVKLDTGMGRTGLLVAGADNFFARLLRSQAVLWEGLFSHFSTSDEPDKRYARLQLARFREILARVREFEKKPPLIHMAASAAILDVPESTFDAVRPGIIMYGHYPSRTTSRSLELKQVMTLKTHVAHVRPMPGGHPISYGRKWSTPQATQIAVLPIGYADGISRRLTNVGKVLIQGKQYPMVGTVTMDYIMVDVADDPVNVGDEVILWGSSPQGTIQAAEVADQIGTIPYELTCMVSKRVRRTYLEAV
jgi:alanine racemase